MFACFGLKTKHKRLSPTQSEVELVTPLNRSPHTYTHHHHLHHHHHHNNNTTTTAITTTTTNNAYLNNGISTSSITQSSTPPLTTTTAATVQHQHPPSHHHPRPTSHGTPLPKRASFRRKKNKRLSDSELQLEYPVKAARPGVVPQAVTRPPAGHNGPHLHPPAPPAHLQQLEQVRRLEAAAAAAKQEKEEVTRAVEALTVLIHHLANTYDPFSTPRLKTEVKRLNDQLTETRLSLDESSAAVRRLQEAECSATERHAREVRELEERHLSTVDQLKALQTRDLDLALEKHRKELAKFAEDQQTQRDEVSRAHEAQVEQLEGEWRGKLDLQHEKHLCALQELNTRHMHQVREIETSRKAKERELEETNFRLQEEQASLRLQSKKLEETLLNDTDHRLAAVRRMCASLKSEVDSLKSVVEMKNAEIHGLRSQVVEVGRLTEDLESVRERNKALQAKTEDLQAQMEKKAHQERSLVNEHRMLVETYQRESNINKRLSLENEELAWKLRQREEIIMSSSCPPGGSMSSLDLVTRAPVSPRSATPQGSNRSPRVAPRGCGSVSPCKSEPGRRRPRGGGGGGVGVEVVAAAPESPPPSPCVKAVVEKSNSVSFILELTGGGGPSGPGTPTTPTSPDGPFHPLSPRRRPHRTASLSAADRPRPSPMPPHARRPARPRAATLGRGAHPHHDLNGGSPASPASGGGGTPHVNGRRSASESSEGGVGEGARVSPTGLAWTVPVRGSGPAPPRAAPRQLLQDPQEDEYECAPRGEAPPRFLEGAGLALTSSSEAASDSELSQCSLKGGSSPDDDEDDDSEAAGAPRPGQGPASARAAAPRCPKDGAGEAMIPDELLQQYGGAAPLSPPDLAPPRGPRRRLPSAPSSDSDENTTPHNDHEDDGDDEAGPPGDASWSEDVDVTSSSEMHDDL